MPGEQRVLELRHHGVLVAEHTLEQRLAGGDLARRRCARISSFTGRDTQPDASQLAECGWTNVAMRRRTYAAATVGSRSRVHRPRQCRHDVSVRSRGSGALGGSWRGDRGRRRPAPRRRRPRLRRRDWAEIAVPGHWRNHPKFATTDGPLLYRHRFRAPPPAAGRAPVDHARRHLLPGRRLARRRLPRRPGGLLLPAHASTSPRCRGSATSTCSRSRSTCCAAAQHRGRAQHHRRVPALGRHRPRLEPGRAVAPRAPRDTGPVRIDRLPRAVPRRRHDARAHLRLYARLDSDDRRTCPRAHARRRRAGRRVRAVARRRASTRSSWNLDIDDPRAVVAVVARRPAADRRVASRCSSTAS